MPKTVIRRGLLAAIGFSSLLGAAVEADTYTYDTQGRLTQVIYTAGGSVTYTYDSAGNRTAQVKAP